jgi:hypothetical protein
MADVAIMEKARLVAELLKLKRELVTQQAELLKQLGEKVKDINAVSRIIAKCDKDAAYIPVFPPRGYKAYFAQGELLALIASVLKERPEGATSKEISDLIEAKQIQAERELPKKLEESVKEALRRMLSRNAVIHARRADNRVIWRLAKRGERQENQAAEAKVEPGTAAGKVTPLRR